jgi:hypothetical protein
MHTEAGIKGSNDQKEKKESDEVSVGQNVT